MDTQLCIRQTKSISEAFIAMGEIDFPLLQNKQTIKTYVYILIGSKEK